MQKAGAALAGRTLAEQGEGVLQGGDDHAEADIAQGPAIELGRRRQIQDDEYWADPKRAPPSHSGFCGRKPGDNRALKAQAHETRAENGPSSIKILTRRVRR
jgi:hypothetical protein